jgi:hypothetical protein
MSLSNNINSDVLTMFNCNYRKKMGHNIPSGQSIGECSYHHNVISSWQAIVAQRSAHAAQQVNSPASDPRHRRSAIIAITQQADPPPSDLRRRPASRPAV